MKCQSPNRVLIHSRLNLDSNGGTRVLCNEGATGRKPPGLFAARTLAYFRPLMGFAFRNPMANSTFALSCCEAR